MFESVDAAVSLKEEPAVSTVQFVGYTGGNLGVFFGWSAFGVIQALIAKIPQRIRLQLQKALRVLLWTITFSLMIPCIYNVSGLYFDATLSSELFIGKPTDLPTIVVCGKWMNHTKLEESFPFIKTKAELMNAEYHHTGTPANVIRLPTLCSHISSLFMLNPLRLGDTDRDIHEDKREQRRSYLEAEIENVLQKLEMTLNDLLLHLALEPGSLIKSVTDKMGKPISYTASPYLSMINGICYGVELLSKNETLFRSESMGVIMELSRDGVSRSCIRDVGNSRLIGFVENIEELYLAGDPKILVGDTNADITVSTTTYNSVSTKSKPCGVENGFITCFKSCLDKLCSKCIVFAPSIFTKQDPPKLSDLCSRDQPLYENCLLDLVLKQQELDQCLKLNCSAPCSRSFTRLEILGQTTTPDGENQKLRIFSSPYMLTIEESKTYSILSYLITVGSLVALFYGYSIVGLIIHGGEYLFKV